MTRSVWKGPFVDGYLLKKADKVRDGGRSEVIKTWSRRSTILPQFVGLTFGVHNGQKHRPGLGDRGHGRPQVRRVRSDPDLLRPRRRQEGEEEVTMGKAKAPRRLADNEARAVLRTIRISPQKLNLVAAADPRQEGRERAERPGILAQAHRRRRARRRWNRRSPTPRTTTTSTSTRWSSPRPMSARSSS